MVPLASLTSSILDPVRIVVEAGAVDERWLLTHRTSLGR
jgi:hypothetical protein